MIKELLSQYNIPIINSETRYWFVRTNGGEYFHRFFFDEFIAIGWDELSDVEALKEMSYKELREKIEKYYPNETKPGLIASYFIEFLRDMKVGDIVLVPTVNSESIAFGKIVSEAYRYWPMHQEIYAFEMLENTEVLYKRRDVKWFHNKPLKRDEIDPYLLSIIYAHNTIVDANPYKDFINRTLYPIYYMDGKLHVTFKINRATDVYASDFVDFVSAILDAGRLCSEMMGEEFDKKGLTIKSSINSPGPVEFIAGSISFLIALAAIALFLNGAKTKLKFDFTLAKGEFDIESEGLLEKLARLRQKQNAPQNIERLEQIENKLIEAQNQLQISGKRN